MNKFQIDVKRYLPTVLSFLACGGVVGTAVMAVKNHEKAVKKFYKYDPTIEYTEEETKEIEKHNTRTYILNQAPTILMGAGTMACIMGSNAMNHNAQAALISSYGLLNESFKDYREKLIEFHGVEEHRRIVDSIAAEQANPPYIDAMGAFNCPSLDASELSKNDEIMLFYDEFSRRYFRSTLAAVLQAEYHVNRNWCLGAVVMLNDWYNFLGLEETVEGNELGWYMGAEEECFWLDFDHRVKYLEDGTRYVSIDVMSWPDTKWQEEW